VWNQSFDLFLFIYLDTVCSFVTQPLPVPLDAFFSSVEVHFLIVFYYSFRLGGFVLSFVPTHLHGGCYVQALPHNMRTPMEHGS